MASVYQTANTYMFIYIPSVDYTLHTSYKHRTGWFRCIAYVSKTHGILLELLKVRVWADYYVY